MTRTFNSKLIRALMVLVLFLDLFVFGISGPVPNGESLREEGYRESCAAVLSTRFDSSLGAFVNPAIELARKLRSEGVLTENERQTLRDLIQSILANSSEYPRYRLAILTIENALVFSRRLQELTRQSRSSALIRVNFFHQRKIDQLRAQLLSKVRILNGLLPDIVLPPSVPDALADLDAELTKAGNHTIRELNSIEDTVLVPLGLEGNAWRTRAPWVAP